MAYEIEADDLRFGAMRAAADLSALQYRFVLPNGSGLIAQNTTAGGRVAGVLQNKPTAAQASTVQFGGVSKVVAGAAVAQGVIVMSDNVGRAVLGTSTNYGIGYSLTAAGGAGETISVLVLHLGTLP